MSEREITELIGLKVYTHKGFYLGRVVDVQLDVDSSLVWELLLSETNPQLVEGSRDLSIPWRWVKSVSDIVVLKYFPGRVRVRKKAKGRRKLRVTKRPVNRSGVPRDEWH